MFVRERNEEKTIIYNTKLFNDCKNQKHRNLEDKQPQNNTKTEKFKKIRKPHRKMHKDHKTRKFDGKRQKKRPKKQEDLNKARKLES